MPRSMTGFGRAVGELAGERFTVEVGAVNHRYFEAAFRLPPAWLALEGPLRESLKQRVSRGKITVMVRRERGPFGRQTVRFDADVAKAYVSAARELAHLMSTTEALSLNTLARMEGVFYHEEDEMDLDRVHAALTETLAAAVQQFNQTREVEGAALAADIAERVRLMREAAAYIETQAPTLNEEYRQRLRERLAELTGDTNLREDRVAIEVALLAEKTDVTEELVRLRAHFAHVDELLAAREPIGRELNFASQEIQREINTLGSKLREVQVTREVLRMKSELEKLREQTQNLE